METLVKINNQSAGRDKIARLLQYLSRFLWHRLQTHNKENVEGIKNLEFQLSTFRKLLRFGRTLDTLYGIKTLLQHDDSTVKYTLILSKVFSSIFLLADHILWLGRADLCNIKTDKWSNISNKYWLYSIAMNLCRDFYEISALFNDQKNVTPKNSLTCTKDVTSFLKTIANLHSQRKVLIDFVKNGCDIFIPLTALGYTNFSPGTIGLLGAISSLAGLLVIIEPSKKLSPA